jgi:hypothetical protein
MGKIPFTSRSALHRSVALFKLDMDKISFVIQVCVSQASFPVAGEIIPYYWEMELELGYVIAVGAGVLLPLAPLVLFTPFYSLH